MIDEAMQPVGYAELDRVECDFTVEIAVLSQMLADLDEGCQEQSA